ncbi:hypothetical protein ACL03H_17270 [Saccharopolyspora sp. MS10]|uniref:hypothetical protein n=1 Tax=Saccharopolyspora sp. MS10 TaxID=3385973 RepID=UPI00399FC694
MIGPASPCVRRARRRRRRTTHPRRGPLRRSGRGQRAHGNGFTNFGRYGDTGRATSIATAHATGVTLIDTDGFHGVGQHELLPAETPRDRDGYRLSVEFGVLAATRYRRD